MQLSFEQLKSMVVFAQVVEQGSFSSAAKQLGLTRAVVSYHVKRLETQLGLKLLNRSTRTHSLTEAGKVYYENCKVIAEQAASAQQLVDNFKNEPEGLLNISCPVNVGLQLVVPALNKFSTLYPKIKLDIQLTDEVVNIIQGGVDLAIRGAPLIDSGLQAMQLSTLKTGLYASPEYLRINGWPNKPAELSQHQWVIYNLAAKNIELSKGNRSFTISPKGTISTNNAAARTAFVEGGHGLAKIPQYDAKPKVKSGTLVALFEDYQLSDINLYGVFPPGTASSKKLRLLLDFLKEHFNRTQVL